MHTDTGRVGLGHLLEPTTLPPPQTQPPPLHRRRACLPCRASWLSGTAAIRARAKEKRVPRAATAAETTWNPRAAAGALTSALAPRDSSSINCGGDEEEDRLSALPDDLLLDVLARLRCARAAAHAGLLARRWRGLWTRVPDLVFHNTELDPPLLAGLARVAGPVASLAVLVPEHDSHDWPSRARVSSLLRAAAALAPAKLCLRVWWRWAEFASSSDRDATELPCFEHATALDLRLPRGRLKLPAAGDFPLLESLSLDCRRIDLGELLRRCPRLHKLCISDREHGSVAVHSQSLEELDVVLDRRLDVVAPALKKLRFNGGAVIDTRDYFSLSFSAPAVEEVSWQCLRHSATDSCLASLTLTAQEIASNSESACDQLQHRSRVLSLDICTCDPRGAAQNFGKEMSRFLFTNVSALELDISTRGHVCGDLLLGLLGLCSIIQRLKFVMLSSSEVSKDCTVNCHRDESDNWRSQNMSFTELKEVEIQGFEGKDHEINSLEVLLRCATVLERVTLRLSAKVSQNDSGYLKITSLLKAYPVVECNVYLT